MINIYLIKPFQSESMHNSTNLAITIFFNADRASVCLPMCATALRKSLGSSARQEQQC
jgi:hypothetical protein